MQIFIENVETIQIASIVGTRDLATGSCPIEALGKLVYDRKNLFGLHNVESSEHHVKLIGVRETQHLAMDKSLMQTIGVFVLTNPVKFGLDKIVFTTSRARTEKVAPEVGQLAAVS